MYRPSRYAQTETFVENAEKRLAKLDKFSLTKLTVQVTVTVKKSGQTVEIMLLRSKDLYAPKNG